MKEQVILIPAEEKDAELLYRLQREAFLPLYEIYRDDETSPAMETPEQVLEKIRDCHGIFFIIYLGKVPIGGIRVRNHEGGVVFQDIRWISPLFIIPNFQNKGLAQQVLQKIMYQYPETVTWRLDTIKQEKKNCHLYEKCGFHQVGNEHFIHPGMSLIEYEKQGYPEQGERSIKIRRMQVEDYGAVYDLWVHTPGMGLNDLDDSREGIEKYLRRNPRTCFVAEKDKIIAGVILAGHDGRRGFIYHTAIGTAYRRQGIGRLLVTKAIEALKQEGIHKVALVAFDRNTLGNAFWEALGFEERTDLVYRNKSIHELKRIDI